MQFPYLPWPARPDTPFSHTWVIGCPSIFLCIHVTAHAKQEERNSVADLPRKLWNIAQGQTHFITQSMDQVWWQEPLSQAGSLELGYQLPNGSCSRSVAGTAQAQVANSTSGRMFHVMRLLSTFSECYLFWVIVANGHAFAFVWSHVCWLITGMYTCICGIQLPASSPASKPVTWSQQLTSSVSCIVRPILYGTCFLWQPPFDTPSCFSRLLKQVP